MRGVGRPVRGFNMTDFVTTPPIVRRSKNCANSRPELAHPLAVKVGAGNQAFPSVVEKSKVLIKLYQLYPIEQQSHPLLGHRYKSATLKQFHQQRQQE